MFEFGEWSIRAEWPSSTMSTSRINSYIYHEPCRTKGRDALDRDGGLTYGDGGWCSSWDVRAKMCFYCKAEMPEEPITVWLIMEGDKLGNYMNDKSEPWKVPGVVS